MVSRVGFTALVALVALQRLLEVRTSNRHTEALLARGAVEHAPGHFPAMQLIHTGWLVAMVAEVWLLERSFGPVLGAIGLTGLLAGQGLRLWARRTLGERWTVRIFTLPGAPAVTGGPFRYLRHPNYLGVVLEIACLPLVHTAWLTALVFSGLNAALLKVRIAAEERALEQDNEYAAHFAATSRLVPGPGRAAGVGTGGLDHG